MRRIPAVLCFALSGYFAFSVIEHFTDTVTASLVFLSVGLFGAGMLLSEWANKW